MKSPTRIEFVFGKKIRIRWKNLRKNLIIEIDVKVVEFLLALSIIRQIVPMWGKVDPILGPFTLLVFLFITADMWRGLR